MIASEVVMKIRISLVLLLLASILSGCVDRQVLPGIYAVEKPDEIPFPTAGYDLYFLGEVHGNREIKLVLVNYLARLYKESGVRDIILEEDQAYETAANEYIHGITEQAPAELCLRADVLAALRQFNVSLPPEEQVSVHLVDVDSPLSTVHAHLKKLYEMMETEAGDVALPDQADFQAMGPGPSLKLVDALIARAGGRPQVVNGLQTVRASIRWYYLGNRMETGQAVGYASNFAPIREEVITANVQFLLKELNGRPALAYFGGAHGMKVESLEDFSIKDFKTWVQRVSEGGAKVYSIVSVGASGSGYWRGETITIDEQIKESLNVIQTQDGTTIVSLFDSHPKSQIIFVDLSAPENAAIQFWSEYKDIPAAQMYDAILIFREFTPMENVCP